MKGVYEAERSRRFCNLFLLHCHSDAVWLRIRSRGKSDYDLLMVLHRHPTPAILDRQCSMTELMHVCTGTAAFLVAVTGLMHDPPLSTVESVVATSQILRPHSRRATTASH